MEERVKQDLLCFLDRARDREDTFHLQLESNTRKSLVNGIKPIDCCNFDPQNFVSLLNFTVTTLTDVIYMFGLYSSFAFFNFNFLMIDDVKHLFLCLLLAIHISSLGNVYSNPLNTNPFYFNQVIFVVVELQKFSTTLPNFLQSPYN